MIHRPPDQVESPPEQLRLLQVCNVGEITGGTAACAWSITRSLPMCEHHIAFLSKISDETRTAFAHCRLYEWSHVTGAAVADCNADVVILHNTPASRWNAPLGVPTIRYVHSLSPPGDEDVRWYCSHWLAAQCGESRGTVVWQGVPRPLRLNDVDREQRTQLIIGRLCTPQLRKWPRTLTGFYRRLSDDFADIKWEFVGCPASLQSELHTACRGRTQFFAPCWKQRRHLWNWDALLYHHPTLTESFGRTAAEAMRAGCLPIVDARRVQ
ncbi:MAG: glycosyltransferase [Planctomycetota bacterium]|nr:glycosyltransferase [Planctomycetota bacterium]MDA1211808.1 glycosyltransferase [Planctomycetota bacterium]